MLTKKELIAAIEGVPDNAVVMADIGLGVMRGVGDVVFDPACLPDTDFPQVILQVQEV